MQGVNKRQELADGLNQKSDLNMERKSRHVNMELFSNSFTQHFLKHQTSRKVILHLDGGTDQFGSLFCFRTAL